MPRVSYATWSIDGLLRDLAARGPHPAVLAIGETGITTWESAALAEEVRRLARGLRRRGVSKGTRVALWAPNSPHWILAALAVFAAGAALAPIDDLANPEQFEAALASSGARLVLTTQAHLDACRGILATRGTDAILLDGAEEGAADWRSLATAEGEELPAVGEEDLALLSWTSGTTGSPKAFTLTHRNIAANVEALRDLGVVGTGDRALLPLPLHHAYPFVVGMLTTLTVGTAIVLPGGTTGPALLHAMREGAVTAIIGVPRLYEALVAAIATRVNARACLVRLLWRALLAFSMLVGRASGLRAGPLLFAWMRRGIASDLRLLVSGGARLERNIEERLEALGWMVLSGYGLAETASLFTGNSPQAHRLGSAGRPLAGGEIRIARPDAEGIGEIELRGAAITKGYLDNPEADRAAFAPDGWFRTGDLGFLDRDGFLFVTGRAKEMLVLGGGKKVAPEDLERVYGASPEVAEIAILEEKGALVALVRADAEKLRARGARNFRDGIRVILAETGQNLPSYQRLSGFALIDTPLPRTRLGKYRRFLLPPLYSAAQAGGVRRPAQAPTAEDRALLADPTAGEIWALLRRRYPEEALDLDTNLGLDLNLDSFSWMELAIVLQEQLGIVLSEADIATVETVRDLLRLSVARRSEVRPPPSEPRTRAEVERWLAPTGIVLTGLGFFLHAFNRLLLRGLFGLSVVGAEGLPESGPYVIAPSHASYLDPMAIAAALPWRRLRHVYWAGDRILLFSTPWARLFSRTMRIFPVDSAHPELALETAARVLEAGDIAVWFPEGWRTPDGKLQRFLPGIGRLLLESGAPAVPAFIAGTFEAWPRSRPFPRLHRIALRFGRSEPGSRLRTEGNGESEEERIADALRRCVLALASEAGAAV